MKIFLSDKSKQLVLWLIKFIIVSCAFLFLFYQLYSKTNNNLWQEITASEFHFSFFSVIVLIGFSVLNWVLEIFKWKNLVNYITPISFNDAAKQVLSGMTLSVFTPNGVGDYGAKILFFEKEKTPTVLLLNFLANGVQMTFTTLFGLLGLGYFFINHSLNESFYTLVGIGLLSILLFFLLVYFLRHKVILGYSAYILFKEVTTIPAEIHFKNAIFGLTRFAVFCHQYLFIFYLLNIDLNYINIMCALFVMYLAASVIPSFQIFDVAIKGSIGIYIFGLLGVESWYIFFAAFIMWLLNYVIPSILGSYYVVKFKYKW